MEDANIHTEIAETASRPRKKTIQGRIVKALLWFCGIWAALLVILQITLSPAILGRIVDRFMSEYVDGSLEFGKIGVNMFRHFPNIGINMEDVSLTYPSDRFDSQEAQGPQGVLLRHGCGETADTLASFRRFSAGINIGPLLAGKISIPNISLEKPRIFAHSYSDGSANWNIFRFAGDNDTTAASLPRISIGRVRLTDHPHIVYTDSRDTLFAIVDVQKISFDGRLDTKKAAKNRIGLSMDSVMVAGRIAADTIGLRMDRLHIHEHNDHMDISAEADATLATRSFGRMDIPVRIKGTAAFPKDTVPTVVMNGFEAEIAAIPIAFDMTLKREAGMTGISGSFNVHECRVEDMIDGFVKNIIPETAKVRTDAAISLSGTCDGYLGGGQLPSFNAVLTVPQSVISHKDIRHDISLAFGADITTDDESRIGVCIEKAELDTYGLSLAAHIDISDLIGEDPLITMDGHFRASADSLLTFLPKDSGITAMGALAAELKGSMRMSQMDIYNFGQAELAGKITSDTLVIRSPKDTIDIAVEGLDINIGQETKVSQKDSAMSVRLLGISGSMAKADISLKDAISIRSDRLSFSAKNSAQALSDTTKIHPLGGYLRAFELAVEDGAGMSITLDETENGFQMMPQDGHSEIPVLSLSSRNKRIYLREQSNRIILTDAEIKAEAAMRTVEQRQRRKARLDSLALEHPEIPRDSLMAFARAQRPAREIPQWMKEDDFKSGDLNFSLDGMFAEYFREWDLSGDIDVRTGIIMTPYMPLRNIIRGMDVSFNNNEVKVDSLKVMSGESELAAKGSLSGLRRALLGRGTYRLDMELSSEKMNADELLAALNAGASFDPDAGKGGMSEASDSEFLKMVVTDSLDTDGMNTLIIVPADLNADIRLNAGSIKFSDLVIDEFTADILMKERCMQIVNSKASTNMGKAEFEGFYATRTKQDIKTGFNMNLSDVTSEKVIAMMPAIDTIMPLLKSFKGEIDCAIAATADLDTCMNIVLPSINGVLRIEGENLTMSENKVFSDLAKKLKFRDSTQAKIDRMTVEGLIKDNRIEVFPFIVDLDRYTLALSGLHNLDMSYRYHASIIRSPIVFKVGVDIYGPDFDSMKFKIGKPKYRSTNVPVFTAVIDETRINLAESIRNIFEKGVEIAVRENEMQQAITDHKEKIGYVNAAEQGIEELTAEEQAQLDKESARAESAALPDSLSISSTLNEIILKKEIHEQPGIH